MPAFSHFFLKCRSARSKFSPSWMMISDKDPISAGWLSVAVK
jgi:hypothetical protein